MMFGPHTDVKSIDAAVKNALLMHCTSIPVCLYGKQGKYGTKGIPLCLSISPLCKCGEVKGIRMTITRKARDKTVLKPSNKSYAKRYSNNNNAEENNEKMNSLAYPVFKSRGSRENAKQDDTAFAHEVVDRVCLAQNMPPFKSTPKFCCFRPQLVLHYHSYCDDFGPMNLACVTRFIELLDQELSSQPSCRIVYLADEGRRALTNAVFLLGAYMILRLQMTPDCVQSCFGWLRPSAVEAFRDASFAEPTFGLTLLDCWRGLDRGRQAGWVGLPSKAGSWWWGQTDVAQYEHYDDAVNGDLHEVVPGKLVATRGPADLAAGGDFSDVCGRREFSPGYYGPVLRELGVTTVVRLNDAEYDAEALGASGIRVHDMAFDDGTVPPDSVVRAFFAVVDAAEGAVAVHCKAGLGRTGTLVALYLMRSHGFPAREAMGWLRIMRPGSVIGEQQHYLCRMEGAGLRKVERGGRVLPFAGELVARRGCRSAFLPGKVGDCGKGQRYSSLP